MQSDLSFLAVPLGSTPTPSAPVNVYDILRDGWRESRVDMTLLYFLDPTERHGLGPVVMDALLKVLDGSPTIARAGKGEDVFDAEQYLGSDAWEISTQVQNIDVLATNVDSSVTVVIENKIGHVLDNPLKAYAEAALDVGNVQTLLVVVLAPERRQATGEQEPWLSKAITYSELTEEIKRSSALVDYLLSPTDQDQRRSLDLLQQFIEVRTGGPDMTDLAAEATRVDEWRALLAEHQAAVTAFLEARSSVSRVLRERNKRLTPLIAADLERAGLVTGWESHSGYGLGVWNAYHFPAYDWSVELKLSADPTEPEIGVYDYPGRTYKDTRLEPLGPLWTTSDEDISEAFVQRTKQILEQAIERGEASSI